MAAINFPNSPTIGDTYAANGTTFQWDGVKWKVYSLVPDDVVFNSVKLDDGTSGPSGTLSWNPDDGTLDLVMRGGSVVQQIGLEQFYNVKNQSGVTITNGTPVYVNGVVGNSGHVTVLPMIANGTIPSKRFIGIATETITNGNDGFVTTFGYVRDLDTTGTPYTQTWAEGDIIYVSQTAAGALTNVQPTSGLVLPVAVVISAHQNVGTLLVRSGPAISATAEDGVLARTALQSGDNVSELTNDAGYATQADVTAAVAAVVDTAPAALDTLNELAAALGDDANFASTVTTSLAGKQSTLVSGTNIKTINGSSLLGSGDIEIAGGGASVTISETPPASPESGNLWWNTADGYLYIYYTDTDSSQWVIATPTFAFQTTAENVTGVVAAANGGTGLTSPGTAGNVLTSTGTGWESQTVALVPPGTVITYAGSTAPAGYLVADGSTQSRSTYASLYAAIGDTYGNGDGTTTFNLPNLVDRMTIGSGSLYALGATGGSKDAIVVEHTHTITDPGHKHTLRNDADTVPDGGTSLAAEDGIAQIVRADAIDNATTGITINSTGTSGTDANLPPFLGLLYCIKF